jgi:hypothetical protein
MSFDPAVRYIDIEIHSDYDTIAEATHLGAEEEERKEENYEPQIVHPLAALPVTADSELADIVNGKKVPDRLIDTTNKAKLRLLCTRSEKDLIDWYKKNP